MFEGFIKKKSQLDLYLVKMFILCSEFSAEPMQGYDTLIYLNWI